MPEFHTAGKDGTNASESEADTVPVPTDTRRNPSSRRQLNFDPLAARLSDVDGTKATEVEAKQLLEAIVTEETVLGDVHLQAAGMRAHIERCTKESASLGDDV